MKYIGLTQGYAAVVDDDMYEILMQFSWKVLITSNNIYAARCSSKKLGKQKVELMHWYTSGQPLKGFATDHINRDGLHNTKENVRTITNRQNTSRRIDKTSNFPGVHYIERTEKWKATIRINGVVTYLGYHEKEVDAFTAYRNKLHSIGEELLPEHEDLWREVMGRA